MRRSASVLLAVALLLGPQPMTASWLSDITGVNVNVPAGTVSFGPPRPDRIPMMLQNLPRDAATFFLNPAGNALAFAIRQAKEQARQNCVPVPPAIVTRLTSFFPPDVFPGVCWATVGSGSNLANFAVSDGNMAAITLEDVVVFANQQMAYDDPVLWSHELTHVLQYRRLGIEGFAAIYSVAWDALEQEARNFDQFVARSIQSETSSGTRYWQSNGWNANQQITYQQYVDSAKQAINPFVCSGGWSAFPGGIRLNNNCPIPIRVVELVSRNVQTGVIWKFPCVLPQCVVPPGTFSTIPEAPGWSLQTANIVW